MKIYNYTDKPVSVNGVAISDHEINLYSNIPKNFVSHNGHKFLTASSTDSRFTEYYIIQRQDGSYLYNTSYFDPPPVWIYTSVFIAFFTFLILIKIANKLKTS